MQRTGVPRTCASVILYARFARLVIAEFTKLTWAITGLSVSIGVLALSIRALIE